MTCPTVPGAVSIYIVHAVRDVCVVHHGGVPEPLVQMSRGVVDDDKQFPSSQAAMCDPAPKPFVPRRPVRELSLVRHHTRPRFRLSLPSIHEDKVVEFEPRHRRAHSATEKLQLGPLPNVQRLLEATQKTADEVAEALHVPPTEIQDLVV